MRNGKDAIRLLPLLWVGAALGCVALPGALVRQTPPPRRPLDRDPQPVPELRIPALPPAESAPDSGRDVPTTAKPESLETDQAAIRRLYQRAAEQYATMDSYIVRLRRREVLNGRARPEELILLKFRKQPWSVYFKWLGPEGRGREAVYVQGRYEGKIHTLLAAGDVPLFPAGKRLALAPDNPLVKAASRHSITETGIGSVLDKVGALLAAAERDPNPRGMLVYLSALQRPEFDRPCEAVEQTVRSGQETLLPRGGKRLVAFDPDHHLPAVIVTLDETGKEVEYYCYDRLQFPVALDDADFDPERLGKKP